MIRSPVRLYLIVLFLASSWLAGLHWFTRGMMAEPPEKPQALDAIVALTGGSNRLENAFNLLDLKLGKKVFISGVYHGVEVRELLDQWKNEDHAELDCCVVLGFEADNTIGNARETIAWMKKEGYTSLYLVTANYHMKRALLAFHRLGPEMTIVPYPVAPEGLDMKNWWRDGKFRGLVLREYSKYIASFIVYAFPGESL
jgi:uncharacterized SAM-binding protein YcdF (DUF218 family)